MPLIKVIWYLIGYVEVCQRGGLYLKKMSVQGQRRYEATTYTANNPPSPMGH